MKPILMLAIAAGLTGTAALAAMALNDEDRAGPVLSLIHISEPTRPY